MENGLYNKDQRLYEKVFRHSPVSIMVIDKKGVIVDMNDRATEWLGWNRDDFVGKSLLKNPSLSSKSKAIAMKNLGQRLLGKKIPAYDLEFKRKDGGKKIGRIQATLLHDDNGKLIGDLVLVADVTDESETARKLAESQDQYRELFENMRGGVAVFEVRDEGESFYFKDFSKGAEYIEGVKRDEVIGKEVRAVFPGSIELGVVAMLRRVHETGEPEYADEGRYLDRKGKVSFRENYIYKLKNGDLVSIYNDVTKKVLRKQQLKISQERFDLAMQGTDDGLWDWNLITGETYLSPNWKSMLGYAEKEIPDSHEEIEKHIHPDDHTRVMDYIRAYIAGGGDAKFEIEYRLKHKDGSDVSVLSRAFLLKGLSGRPARIVGTNIDISQRLEYEKKLMERSREMQRFNKMMVGRELKMVELKKEIEKLKNK